MPYFQTAVARVPVRDLARTVQWYADVLGFERDLVWPDVQPTFAIMVRDDISLQFFVPEPITDGMFGHAILNLQVRDIQALHRLLTDRVPIAWGPGVYWYGRREFAVLDPDGYMLTFTEPTTDEPTDLE